MFMCNAGVVRVERLQKLPFKLIAGRKFLFIVRERVQNVIDVGLKQIACDATPVRPTQEIVLIHMYFYTHYNDSFFPRSFKKQHR